jgi:predicted dienelactone hydrolase
MPVSILGFWQLRGRNLFSRLVWTATTTAAFTWRSPWIQQQPPSRSYYQNTMSSFATQRNSGTITVSPKNEEDQSALVVISHGLGDTAEGFADVAEVRELWRGVSFIHLWYIFFI